MPNHLGPDNDQRQARSLSPGNRKKRKGKKRSRSAGSSSSQEETGKAKYALFELQSKEDQEWLNNLQSQTEVTAEQWELAKTFFAQNKNAVKLSRKYQSEKDKASSDFLEMIQLNELGHSFLKVNGQIWALQPGQYLGAGGFGAVKKCFNEQGETYAVKIKLGPIGCQ